MPSPPPTLGEGWVGVPHNECRRVRRMTIQLATAPRADNHRLAGMIHGAIGMAIFAGSLPATRVAVLGLDPIFLTAGRAAGAGILAVLLLAATRQKLPARTDIVPLLVVAGGVV